MKAISKLFNILIIITTLTLSIMCWNMANAATLSCGYSGAEKWEIIDGYNIYYNAPSKQKIIKTIYKSDVTTDNVTIEYPNIEEQLRLQPKVEYTIYMTAFNSREESKPSNNCTYEIPEYAPPENNLPPVIIHISAPVTIIIGE